MKKIVALLLGIMLVLASVSAFAEDVKLGQVQYAAHGKQSFAVLTAAVQGDTILDAWIDEFQVMSGEGVVGVPNSGETFGANIVGSEDGKVLGTGEIEHAAEAAEELLREREKYRESISRCLAESVYHPGESARIEANYIVSAIQRKIRERRETSSS